MAAKGAEPHRVAQDGEATGAGYTQHFLAHIPGVGDVLGHVGGIDHVKGIIGKGQVGAIATHGIAQVDAGRRHLAGIRLQSHIAGAATGKSIRKIARSAAHIEHPCSRKLHAQVAAKVIHQRGRILREPAVENVRARLLKAEGTQQLNGAAERGHLTGMSHNPLG